MFKLPEGATLEGDDLTAVQGFAKDLNLTQEQAQKLVDRELSVRESVNASLQAEAQSARTAWTEAAKTDTEFGGDKFDENLGLAKTALETFGSPELKTMLEKSGMDNHPEAIRFFYKVGQAISEDKLVQGDGKAPEPKRFFTNSNHAL